MKPRLVMKKKNILFSSILAFPFSVFAASQGNQSTWFEKFSLNISEFKDSMFSFFGSLNSFLVQKLSSFGDSVEASWNSFLDLNRKAGSFIKTYGLDFLSSYWVEVLGGVFLLIGLIFLLQGVFYKPRYSLETVPSNAVPLKKAMKGSLKDKERSSSNKDITSQFQSSVSDQINPVNVPHVESFCNSFANSSSSKKIEDEEIFEKLRNTSNIDKEDLEFFETLSKNFNK